VFFYQSPYGGRVFFDELGPPWPKHPCTDNTSIPSQARTNFHSHSTSNPNRIYQWLVDGWKPFFITSARPIDKEILEIHGLFDDREVCLYIRKIIEHTESGNPVSAQSIAHIRPFSNERFEVSIVTNFGKVETIFAFKMASDARVSQPKPHKPKGSTRYNTQSQKARVRTANTPSSTRKQQKLKQEQRRKKNLPAAVKQKKMGSNSCHSKKDSLDLPNHGSRKTTRRQPDQETAMSLAFAAAKKKGPTK
jgi:hypothetical protein